MDSPSTDRDRSTPPRALNAPPDDVVAGGLLCAVGHGDLAALGAFYDLTASTVYTLLHTGLGEQRAAQQATERVYQQLWRVAPRFDSGVGSATALVLRLARRELASHIHTSIATRAAANATAIAPAPVQRY